jgi:hypothetical protein
MEATTSKQETTITETTKPAIQQIDPLALVACFPTEVKLKILGFLVKVPRALAIRWTIQTLYKNESRAISLNMIDLCNCEQKWKQDARKTYFEHDFDAQRLFLKAEFHHGALKLVGRDMDFISWSNDTIYLADFTCRPGCCTCV